MIRSTYFDWYLNTDPGASDYGHVVVRVFGSVLGGRGGADASTAHSSQNSAESSSSSSSSSSSEAHATPHTMAAISSTSSSSYGAILSQSSLSFGGGGEGRGANLDLGKSTAIPTKKCAVHIHGIHPYFYLQPAPDKRGMTMRQIQHEIEMGLLAKRRRFRQSQQQQHSETSNNNNANFLVSRAVHSVTSVTDRIPVYGYHEGRRRILRVEMKSPEDVRLAAEAALSLGLASHVFEAHLPFLLQFMVDYHIYGMGEIRFEGEVKLRGEELVPPTHDNPPDVSHQTRRRRRTMDVGLEQEEEEEEYEEIHENPEANHTGEGELGESTPFDAMQIPDAKWFYAAPQSVKHSSCEVEMDVWGHQIVIERVHHPKVKAVEALASWYIRDEKRRERFKKMNPPNAEERGQDKDDEGWGWDQSRGGEGEEEGSTNVAAERDLRNADSFQTAYREKLMAFEAQVESIARLRKQTMPVVREEQKRDGGGEEMEEEVSTQDVEAIIARWKREEEEEGQDEGGGENMISEPGEEEEESPSQFTNEELLMRLKANSSNAATSMKNIPPSSNRPPNDAGESEESEEDEQDEWGRKWFSLGSEATTTDTPRSEPRDSDEEEEDDEDDDEDRLGAALPFSWKGLEESQNEIALREDDEDEMIEGDKDEYQTQRTEGEEEEEVWDFSSSSRKQTATVVVSDDEDEPLNEQEEDDGGEHFTFDLAANVLHVATPPSHDEDFSSSVASRSTWLTPSVLPPSPLVLASRLGKSTSRSTFALPLINEDPHFSNLDDVQREEAVPREIKSNFVPRTFKSLPLVTPMFKSTARLLLDKGGRRKAREEEESDRFVVRWYEPATLPPSPVSLGSVKPESATETTITEATRNIDDNTGRMLPISKRQIGGSDSSRNNNAVSQLTSPTKTDNTFPASAGDPSRKNRLRIPFQARDEMETEESEIENRHFRMLGVELICEYQSNARGREGGMRGGKPFALRPDPKHDRVLAIVYMIRCDDFDHSLRSDSPGEGSKSSGSSVRGRGDVWGVMMVDDDDEDDEEEEAVGEERNWNRKTRNMMSKTIGTKYDSRCLRRERFDEESAMLAAFVRRVREVDPDAIFGWEVQRDSWGYLMDRALALGMVGFSRSIGRVPYGPQDRRHRKDKWGDREHSGFWFPGRHVFNVWRLVREQAKLSSYTLQAVYESLTGKPLPLLTPAAVCDLWRSPVGVVSEGTSSHPSRALQHVLRLLSATLAVMDHLDIVGRASELANILGMDLFSVLTRGSQFRVEAVLARVARARNFLLLTGTRRMLRSQPPLLEQPFIKEPKSGFYKDPVLVLDFRSLYPSIVIANNLCYSTCLGKLDSLADPSASSSTSAPMPHVHAKGALEEEVEAEVRRFFKRGLGMDRDYMPSAEVILSLVSFTANSSSSSDSHNSNANSPQRKRPFRLSECFISPNGCVFLPARVREGVLPEMLSDILAARDMIKRAMGEEAKRRPSVWRVMDSRQFACKMVANVTYGYAAASFSGRMPCSDLADAIVSSARAVLMRAIEIVRGEGSIQPCEVVYGDTDSLFVSLKGRSLDEARRIGERIAEVVTSKMKPPIRLQFDKIYKPCILEVKKRYVGRKFPAKSEGKKGEMVKLSTSEAEGSITLDIDDEENEMKSSKLIVDAKGIEIVRRDGCGVLTKAMDAVLKEMFTRADLSTIRSLLERQFEKMYSGQTSTIDYILSGKCKLGSYAKDRKRVPGKRQIKHYPPAAIVGDRRGKRDARAKPLWKERVPYVVVVGVPGAPLVDLVVDPYECHALSVKPNAPRINVDYYVWKQIIPALDRLLAPAGVFLASWFSRAGTKQRHFRTAGISGVPAPLALGGFAWRSSRTKGDVSSILSYLSQPCVLCGALETASAPSAAKRRADANVAEGLCTSCASDPQRAMIVLQTWLKEAETRLKSACDSCKMCENGNRVSSLSRLYSSSRDVETARSRCINLDCYLYHTRVRGEIRVDRDAETMRRAVEALASFGATTATTIVELEEE